MKQFAFIETCKKTFVWFDALHPSQQLKPMVMLGWSVHQPHISWALLTKRLTSTSSTYFRLYLTTTHLESAEGRKMAVEIYFMINLNESMVPAKCEKHKTRCIPNKYKAHSRLFTIPLPLVKNRHDFNAIFSSVFHYLPYAFSIFCF